MTTAPARSRNYTPAQVDLGLLALATYGSAVQASKILRAQHGLAISPRLLNKWRQTTHAERWVELSNRHGREIQARHSAQLRDLIGRLTSAQMLAVEQAIAQLEDD